MKQCLTVSQEYLKRSTTTCIKCKYTHNALRGVFFFFAVRPQAHTHTHRPQAHANAKKVADRRRCNTTFRECKPTTANENTTEKQGCNTTFRECKPNDLRPLQRRCVVLHIDKSINYSLSRQAGRASRFTTAPDKSTAVNRCDV